MSTSEIATVLAWHDAVNSNDIETLLALSSDDIVLPTGDDDEDQGLDELREWATTAGVTFQPGRMFVHEGIVVVEETATWARLSRHFDTRQLMEISFVVGTYLVLAFVLNSAGIQLDADLDPAIAPAIPPRED